MYADRVWCSIFRWMISLLLRWESLTDIVVSGETRRGGRGEDLVGWGILVAISIRGFLIVTLLGQS